ncbi:MAG: MlaD family protein [Geminicoccaceae bacterium]
MSAKAKPVRIGVFVVGAVALVVAGLLAFGGRDLFTERPRYIAYFQGSVAGLRVGAPVNFRGVPIGEVVDIRLRYHTDSGDILLPVLFETSPQSIDVVGSDDFQDQEGEAEVQRLIERGLRAQLSAVSMVTGQLAIELAIRPASEPKLVGGDDAHIEIPTIPSSIQALESQVRSLLESKEANQGVKDIINDINQLLGEDNRRHVSAILANLADITGTFSEHDDDIASVIEGGAELITKAEDTLLDLRKLLESSEAAVTDLSEALVAREDDIVRSIEDFDAAAQSIARMADQINNAVREVRPGLKDFSDTTLYAADGLVLDLEQLTQKLSRIADQLERDPPGFLFGGQAGQGIKTP